MVEFFESQSSERETTDLSVQIDEREASSENEINISIKDKIISTRNCK